MEEISSQGQSIDVEHAHDERLALGIVGGALLIAGVFCPVVSLPLVGALPYVGLHLVEALAVAGLGLHALVSATSRRPDFLWMSGPAALAVLGWSAANITYGLISMQSAMPVAHSDDELVRAVRSFFLAGVQVQWGCGVLVVGAVLVTLAAALRPGAERDGYENPFWFDRAALVPLAAGAGVAAVAILGSFAFSVIRATLEQGTR